MESVSQEEIENFVEHTLEVLDAFEESTVDEQTTKQYIISNFLENVLGWPLSEIINGTLVRSEYPIQIASNKKKVDYALVIDGEPVCIVEAKRLSVSLSEPEKKQIKSYMKEEELVWGILTNGKEYCFYIRDDKDTIKEIEISHTTYSNLSSIQELVSLYTYSNLCNKWSEEKRESVLKQYRRIKSFDLEENKNTLYDVLNPQNEIEEKLIDEFIEDYQRVVEESQSISSGTSPSEDLGTNKESKDSIVQVVEKNTPIKIEDGEVLLSEDQTARSQLRSVVELLFEQDYLTSEDVPLERGNKRHLINKKPVDSEGEDMFGPKELSNGYYLETNYSSKDCRNIIAELLEL